MLLGGFVPPSVSGCQNDQLFITGFLQETKKQSKQSQKNKAKN